MTQQLTILNKNTKEELAIPARDFLNPKSSSFKDDPLKPKTFNQAFTMLMDLIEGSIYQTANHAITLTIK